VSLEKTLLLGFIAGVTILLGLPIGRLKRPAPTLRMMLNAVAVGVLLFLVWDVLSHAWEPIDAALGDFHAGNGGLGTAFGYGLLFAGGLTVGLLGLVAYERWMDRITHTPDATLVNGTSTPGDGPGRGNGSSGSQRCTRMRRVPIVSSANRPSANSAARTTRATVPTSKRVSPPPTSLPRSMSTTPNS